MRGYKLHVWHDDEAPTYKPVKKRCGLEEKDKRKPYGTNQYGGPRKR